MKTGAGLASAVIYTGISLLAAGLFYAAASHGGHGPLARFGGAAWVFFLSMIVLMPIVTPFAKKRRGARTTPEANQ